MADYASQISSLTQERDRLVSGKEALSGNVSSVIDKFNDIGGKVNTISSDNLKDTEDTLLGSSMLEKNKLIIDSVNKAVQSIGNGADTANRQIDNRVSELNNSINAKRALEKEEKPKEQATS